MLYTLNLHNVIWQLYFSTFQTHFSMTVWYSIVWRHENSSLILKFWSLTKDTENSIQKKCPCTHHPYLLKANILPLKKTWRSLPLGMWAMGPEGSLRDSWDLLKRHQRGPKLLYIGNQKFTRDHMLEEMQTDVSVSYH